MQTNDIDKIVNNGLKEGVRERFKFIIGLEVTIIIGLGGVTAALLI